jgi:hypothetical protein
VADDRERGRWPLVGSIAFIGACSGAWPFATEPCLPAATGERVAVAEDSGPPPWEHLQQLGRSLPVAESPPATGDGWAESGLTGRVIVRQSLGSAAGGYAWGVEVETPEGAPVLLQPLPMRTRAVGLRLSAGEYMVSTYRHGCLDGCARVTAPVRHCRSRIHLESEGVVELGESAPDRSCRLLHRPPAPEPDLASVGVRHLDTQATSTGWVLRVVEGDTGRGGETQVALAPYVDALAMWVDAGTYAVETHTPGHPERVGCRSRVAAEVGDAIEVVHTHGQTACRPYRATAPLASFGGPGVVTLAGR